MQITRKKKLEGTLLRLLKSCASALAVTLLTSLPAAAHTSYLLPSVFITGEGGYLTLQASFTEDFFVPEIAVISDDYHLVRPDGSRDDFDAITEFRQMVVLENALEEDGTYRFTTGTRLGRIAKRALVDGEWKTLHGPDGEVPENATDVMTSQTETVADVYVTKGAPTWEAVEAPIGRLSFDLEAHPNEIYLDEGLEFDVLFDGEPLADQTVHIYRQGGDYEEPKFHPETTTDAEGHVSLSFDAPGIYLIMTRHATEAPEGAETDERSYTTSLTFEVLR